MFSIISSIKRIEQNLFAKKHVDKRRQHVRNVKLTFLNSILRSLHFCERINGVFYINVTFFTQSGHISRRADALILSTKIENKSNNALKIKFNQNRSRTGGVVVIIQQNRTTRCIDARSNDVKSVFLCTTHLHFVFK
jgi:hypothetical protein